MKASGFFRFELRTRDLSAARVLYTDLFGPDFWDANLSIASLPERAAAQGAPAHWLGHIAVGDVERTALQVVEHGGQRLGSTQQEAEGSSRAILRDPFGAVFALSSERPGGSALDNGPVVWHLHHGHDHQRTFAWYARLFGWTATEVRELAPQMGSNQLFAWNDSGRAVGSMANTASLPHIHPQWLCFFRVADIVTAVAKVRAHGGIALEPIRASTGDILAPCDDPQGAAFALYQFARDLK